MDKAENRAGGVILDSQIRGERIIALSVRVFELTSGR
jgi:hypothetical protein